MSSLTPACHPELSATIPASSGQPAQIQAQQPAGCRRPQRTRADRQASNRTGMDLLGPHGSDPSSTKAHQASVASRPHHLADHRQRTPGSLPAHHDPVPSRVQLQQGAVGRVAHPDRLAGDHDAAPGRPKPPRTRILATTRLLAGSTCQTGPRAARTHTPRGLTPTASGRPGRSIRATTRLAAGSTRTSPVQPPSGTGLPQHTTHTPPAPTAIDSWIGPTGTTATTRLPRGSIRTTPTSGTAPQTAPAPTARPRTQRSLRPVPATLATTRLVLESTRQTSHPATAHTTPGLVATASTDCPPTLILAATGEEIVVAGWSGRSPGRWVDLVACGRVC